MDKKELIEWVDWQRRIYLYSDLDKIETKAFFSNLIANIEQLDEPPRTNGDRIRASDETGNQKQRTNLYIECQEALSEQQNAIAALTTENKSKDKRIAILERALHLEKSAICKNCKHEGYQCERDCGYNHVSLYVKQAEAELNGGDKQ